ncbi:MAG: hypothetical protein WBF33_38085 [Candidatus Nitrosopolaris sp.]
MLLKIAMNFRNILSSRKEEFDKIQGYDDVKNMINRALNTDENFNLFKVR